MTDVGVVLLNLAGVALVAALLPSNLRRLRWIALGAGILAFIGFSLTGSDTGMTWSAVFVLVGAVQLLLIRSRSRRGLVLDEEREMFAHVIRITDPDKQRHLRDVLRWCDVEPGSLIIEQGQPSPPLIYIARGKAAIERDGAEIGECGPEDFLGEMSLISGETASASVRASEPMRVAYFDRDSLLNLTREVPELGKAIDSALNRSLSDKIVRMNQAASSR